MKQFLGLELARYRRTAVYFAGSTLITLLAALYFFALIGRFDDSPENAVLGSRATVIPIALTVTLSVMAIHGAVIYARFIVADYVGNRRIQLYSYPGGRGPLFLAKNLAFTAALGVSGAASVLVGTTVFLVSEAVAPIIEETAPGGSWLGPLSAALFVAVLAVGAAVVAGVIGVRRHSTITTVVAVVVLVALCGNAVAASLTGTPWLTAVIACAVAATAFFALASQGRRIHTDEVL